NHSSPTAIFAMTNSSFDAGRQHVIDQPPSRQLSISDASQPRSASASLRSLAIDAPGGCSNSASGTASPENRAFCESAMSSLLAAKDPAQQPGPLGDL